MLSVWPILALAFCPQVINQPMPLPSLVLLCRASMPQVSKAFVMVLVEFDDDWAAIFESAGHGRGGEGLDFRVKMTRKSGNSKKFNLKII